MLTSTAHYTGDATLSMCGLLATDDAASTDARIGHSDAARTLFRPDAPGPPPVCLLLELSPVEMLDALALAGTASGRLVLVLQHVGVFAASRRGGAHSPWLSGALGAVIAAWVTFFPVSSGCSPAHLSSSACASVARCREHWRPSLR